MGWLAGHDEQGDTLKQHEISKQPSGSLPKGAPGWRRCWGLAASAAAASAAGGAGRAPPFSTGRVGEGSSPGGGALAGCAVVAAVAGTTLIFLKLCKQTSGVGNSEGGIGIGIQVHGSSKCNV